MGAVYKSADLSTGFKVSILVNLSIDKNVASKQNVSIANLKVKKFITKDAVIFPIDIDFERTHTGEDTGTEQVCYKDNFSFKE